MKVGGSCTAGMPSNLLIPRITDMSMILPCLEGIQRVDRVSADTLEGRIRIREGAVRGSFDIAASIAAAGNDIRLIFRLNGTLGTATGTVDIGILGRGEETTITYTGEVEVRGLAAAVAEKTVEDATRKLIDRIVTCLTSSPDSRQG